MLEESAKSCFYNPRRIHLRGMFEACFGGIEVSRTRSGIYYILCKNPLSFAELSGEQLFGQKNRLHTFWRFRVNQQKSVILSETQESWDVCRNSSKSGETHFLVCFGAMRREHVFIYFPPKPKSHFSKN